VTDALSSLKDQSKGISQQLWGFQSYLEDVGGGIVGGINNVVQLGTSLRDSAGQILSVLSTISSDIRAVHGAVMSLQRPLEGEHQYFLLEDPAG